MENLHKKITDNGGVTILMALMLLLVAVFVSSIILTTSLTGLMAKRTDIINEQEYLTVSSALNLFRDDIIGSRCTVYDEDGEIDTVGTTNLADEIIENCFNGTSSTMSTIYEYTVSSDGFADVKAAYTMDYDSKDIEIKFYTDSCVMYLLIEPQYEYASSYEQMDADGNITTVDGYERYIWIASSIEKDTDNSELKYYDE